jgi:iron complex transport system permease protein
LTALSLLLLLALLAFVLAAGVGSVGLSLPELGGALVDLLSGTFSSTTASPSSLASTLLELRLQRAMAGFVTGATLATAGVLMQALLRNPLADPYVLGVSGGAAVGALASILCFGTLWSVNAGAFGGAFAVAFLLLLLAHRDLRGGMVEGNTPILLLTGVIVSAGCSALITLMLSVASDMKMRGMVFWMIGDLSGTQMHWLPLLVLAGVLLYALRSARAINVLAMHAENAATLGIRVGVLRRGLFVSAALLTASAVASAGSIGFVGLIVPHACRFVLGPDHRLLLPASALVGGTFLVLADTLARTVMAPQQLPVGVVTALIGVPVFLLQLHHVRKN